MARTKFIAPILIAVGFGVLYWEVLGKLVQDWATDDNYSHGFLVVPLAFYFAWERRRKLLAIPVIPAWSGLLVIASSLALLAAGVLGAELFLTRVSLVGTLTGAIIFMLGWRHVRELAFPIGFLLLMIPIPAIIFNQIAFPLQIIASRVGEFGLSLSGIPVLREGNVIVLANASLEVAEACSGIRSLISLLTLGIVYGYFTDNRPAIRAAVALSTVPVAVLANGSRVAGIGIAASYFGQDAATGLFHDVSGWLVFLASFAMLFVVMRAITWLFPVSPAGSVPAMATAGFGVQQ